MIGLKELTHITRDDDGAFVTHSLRGNWQGVNAMKSASVGADHGNVPNHSVVVRIPLDILGDIVINKNDFIVLGAAEVGGMTQKQLFAAYDGHIVRVNAVQLWDGLSARVNHLEVSGS